MKSIEEIKQRIKELEIREKQAAKDLKDCEYEFMDIMMTRANMIQQERMILEWVLK